MSSLLLELPDDSLRSVASFLCAPDLLAFLSSHPHFYQLSKSESFWRSLNSTNSHGCDNNNTSTDNNEESCRHAKRVYLTKAYAAAMPVIQWKPCRSSRLSPTGREGHLACTMGKRIIITGGFTDDERIYILDTSTGTDTDNPNDWIQVMPTQAKCFRHPDLPVPPPQRAHIRQFGAMAPPEGEAPLASVYGASLTPLDEHRAIQFGGFRGGGYTGECNQIGLLTLSAQNNNSEQQQQVTATWQIIHPKNYGIARAYHSATLIAGRYLLVIGGMTDAGCIRSESILDTHTWTWFNHVSQEMVLPKPTGRHGHSAVLDEKRDRIVLFGGGSGNDLLRSGRDNAEVWQLRMGPQWRNAANSLQELQDSLPWEWAPIKMNTPDEEEDDESNDEDGRHYQGMVDSLEEDDTDFHSANESDDDLPPLEEAYEFGNTGGGHQNNDNINNTNSVPRRANRAPRCNPLSDVEKLSLGRCHLGFKVGPDTVILAFGSGRPSTNGVLGFCLATNSFIRPQLANHRRLMPCPRFTCAGAMFGENNSYMLVHGGYSTQEGMAIGNMCVLDLAPALQRRFTALPDNPDFATYPPVTQDDINRHSMFGGHHFGMGGHGMGIGGMEDLLQNLFVEFAAGAGGRGRPAPDGPVRLGGGRNLGELLGILAGRGRPADVDNDDQEEDDEDDEDAPDQAMLFNFVMQEAAFAAEEEEDDDDSGYDSANISEVS
ncbi:FBOX [Seminavis robusta]|uniref:FBOX n=1 Tax=Seminavis robusta TaxID=568900 RepID=A0A9N8DIX9_9STRA|nr:FBOX [Seminavis robusta]|eukprot:Sro168_g074880.1 FBOX (714) ;mRNA; r:73454-75894